MTTERKKQFIIDVLFILTLVGIAYFAFKYLLGWLLPFLIAFALARLAQGPICLLSRRIRISKKIVAPIITFVLVFVLIFLAGTIVYSAVLEVVDLVSRLPALYAANAPAVIANVSEWAEGFLGGLPEEIESLLRGMLTQASTAIQSWLVNLSAWAISFAASSAAKVPNLLIGLLLTIVATFFISADYDNVKGFFRRQIPQKYRSFIAGTAHRFGKTIGEMARSYALIMLLTCIELSIGLTVLGVGHSILLAVLMSLVDILPVLGVGTVLIPWALISMISGDLPFGIKMLVLYLIITLVRNFLEPKIIGNRIGLNPLVTMVFMYVGLRLMGILGMFLFPLTIIMLNDMQRSGMIKLWNNRGDGDHTVEDTPE